MGLAYTIVGDIFQKIPYMMLITLVYLSSNLFYEPHHTIVGDLYQKTLFSMLAELV